MSDDTILGIIGVLYLIGLFNLGQWLQEANDAKTISHIEHVNQIKWHEKRDLKRIINGTYRFHDGVYYQERHFK